MESTTEKLMRLCFYVLFGAAALYANAVLLSVGLEWGGVFHITAVKPGNFILAYVVIGLIGAAVSWFMAKSVSDWSLGAKPYADEHVRATTGDLRWAVRRLTQTLNLGETPSLAVYASPHVNAFAIDRGMGAAEINVSTGLLAELSGEEAEAVLAQAAAKLASRDGLTLQLLRGMINPFTILPTRMFSLLMGTSPRTADEETPVDAIENAMRAVLELALAPVSGLLARAFARGAERRADARVATVLGRERMLGVLARLREESPPQATR
jgi:heat shock protein HtpX